MPPEVTGERSPMSPARGPAYGSPAANGSGLAKRIARLLGQPRPASHTLPGPAAAWALSMALGILLLAGIGAAVVRAAQDQTAERPRPRPVAAAAPPEQELTVSRDALWIDTVKLGDLTRAVRALGVFTAPDIVELRVSEEQMKDVKSGQAVAIGTRGGQESLTGVVTRIGAGVLNGTVAVEVHLPGTHPAQAGAEADGTIEIERLTNVLQVGRPVMGQPGSEGALYKLEPDGKQAVRVKVRFGKSSVNAIEIRSGLQPGDKVILSDTTAFHSLDRVNLK